MLSLGCNIYFITFIYERTRMLWFYTIKVKSEACEAFEVFKKFKILIEKDSGKAIKILRTDGGGKYI